MPRDWKTSEVFNVAALEIAENRHDLGVLLGLGKNAHQDEISLAVRNVTEAVALDFLSSQYHVGRTEAEQKIREDALLIHEKSSLSEAQALSVVLAGFCMAVAHFKRDSYAETACAVLAGYARSLSNISNASVNT